MELLGTPLKELEERFEAVQGDFNRLQGDKHEILSYIVQARREITSLARVRVKEFFLSVDTKVPGWAEGFL